MTVHTVLAGECLSSIAHRYGLPWRTIYEHSDNAEFRRRRPNPNVIYEGDRVVIPDIDRQQASGAAGRTHRFQLISDKWIFRLLMSDDEGNPIAGVPYELEIQNHETVRGKTTADGLIATNVPPHVREGTLRFLGETMRVQFGMLDPVSRVKGIQARLNNLGFDAGAVDGVIGPRTRRAVYEFQRSQQGLQATGELDDATRQRLLEVHDNDRTASPAEEPMEAEEAGETSDETVEGLEEEDDGSGDTVLRWDYDTVAYGGEF